MECLQLFFFVFLGASHSFHCFSFLDLNQEIMQPLLAKQAKVILKGPIFGNIVAGIFTQIRHVLIGELETRPKTSDN